MAETLKEIIGKIINIFNPLNFNPIKIMKPKKNN